MSLSGSLNVAVAGLQAQSRSLGHISDNIANSSTSGYKRIDTRFSTLVTVSTPSVHQPGGVRAVPFRPNDIQGAVTSTGISTNLAMAGEGFFAVSKVRGEQNGLPVFETDPLYTRAADFTINKDGFLVNSGGYFLNAWNVSEDAQGSRTVDRTSLQPLRISQLRDAPSATTIVKYSANLPSGATAAQDTRPGAGSPGIDFAPTQVTIFDQLGNDHTLNVSWTKSTALPNVWTATFNLDGDDTPNTLPNLNVSSTNPEVLPAGAATETVSFDFRFAPSDAAGFNAGSITGIRRTTVPPGGFVDATPGNQATLNFNIDYGNLVTQVFTLNLGTYGRTDGLTQYAGTNIDSLQTEQNGVPPGSFRDLTIDENGFVTLNYDNGRRKTFFQIPVAQFNNSNALQLQQGNAYSATFDSGNPALTNPGGNGAGAVVASSLEGSNVDIADEFSKMIVTQRVYSANARIITTASTLLDETVNLVR
ncbi:MAG TPA: flagellar hook protein FlgE [Alphaproteobacteria bacterium]|nr:flagellar hook protein FlgE [Alphaproteobacteria bacterium]